jgi:purine-nucleoside phosphorylase
VNPSYEVGDLMIIDDHINLFPTNPLIGRNMDELGPRFPDMSEPYSKLFIAKAKQAAEKLKINVRTGVYAGLSGPTYETRAEYAMVQKLGADAVGMSTVPEVIAARHMGLSCFGISVITDLGVAGKIAKVTHEEVQHVAAAAEKKMTALLTAVISSL